MHDVVGCIRSVKGENKMTVRQQLLFLIEKYFLGEYDTRSYTSYLVKLYHIENRGELTPEGDAILEPRVDSAVKYSPFEKDFQSDIGSKFFVREDVVRTKNKEAYQALLKLYQMESLAPLYEEKTK